MKLKIKLNSADKVRDFIRIISKQEEDFDLVAGKYVVDAKSIMGVYSLNLSQSLILVSSSADYNKMRLLLTDFVVSADE